MSTPPERPPSMNDILTAMSIFQRPAPEEKGLAKHASTIVVAIILALCLWVGASVTSLSTTVTRMSANLDSLQKSMSDLQASQSAATGKVADIQAAVAKQDARVLAVEQDQQRMRDRLRIVEGQKPLGPADPL